jgi:S1-C subfamily serine protease
VGKGLVLTNAHVVAGEHQTDIEENGATYRASPVLYDPSLDIAVLRTSAPLGPPLRLDSQAVGRGTQGAILGYPEDGPLTVGSAGVMTQVAAEGRDIYNNGLVTRDVYEINATVRPGNSGGPLVGPDGSVVGVVFSRSTIYPNVGYALASPEVLQRVDQASSSTATVGTGTCVQG